MTYYKFIGCLFLSLLLLSGCAGTTNISVGQPTFQPSNTVAETIHMNNCGGKADAEQTAERSQSITIEGEGNVGANVQVLEASVAAKYSKSDTVTKSLKLVAPAGTDMGFVLLWTEDVQTGVITVEGKGGQATYRINTPISIELVSSKDLGCTSAVSANSTVETPSQVENKPLLPSATPTEALPAKLQPTITDAQGVEMALISAGEFLMGSTNSDSQAYDNEKPQHRLYLDEYYIDTYEVTNTSFEQFVQDTSYQTTAEKTGGGYAHVSGSWDYVEGADWRHPHGPSSSLDGLGNHPVVQVSWDDATAYCEWRGARLPTEAQWEKAARGTDERIYPWGNTFDGSRVNFCDKNCSLGWATKDTDDGYAFTAPVGSYPSGASPYGLYDMAGNAWEWVRDWYLDTFYNSSPFENPAGPSSGQYRIVRGGSWDGVASVVRTALRYRVDLTDRNVVMGLRCVRSP